jgi:hypothetical protein
MKRLDPFCLKLECKKLLIAISLSQLAKHSKYINTISFAFDSTDYTYSSRERNFIVKFHKKYFTARIIKPAMVTVR